MFDPADEIAIRLSVAEWNSIMGILGDVQQTAAARANAVAGLIAKINGQAAKSQIAGSRPPADGAAQGSAPGRMET